MGEAVAQTAVILGGGFFPDGTLTNLSRQRLDAGAQLFLSGQVLSLTVLGTSKSTYLPNALSYDRPGAEKRAEYLQGKGIPSASINKIIDGRDTIGEALACRKALPDLGISNFILVTSDIHMARAMWIFSTILSMDFVITPYGVPCGGLLLPDEEAVYLETTQNYFAARPGILENVDDWHNHHAQLYRLFKDIHDRFHPPGKESEAYCAVKKSE